MAPDPFANRIDLEVLRIRKVAPITDHRVLLTLNNGDVVERDLSALLWGPVLESLRADANRVRQVTVSGARSCGPAISTSIPTP